MTVGCLEALAILWPRIAMNLWEIKTIARHVLCLEAVSSNGMHHEDDGPTSDHGAASERPIRPLDANNRPQDDGPPDLEQLFEWGDLAGVDNFVVDNMFVDPPYTL